VAGPRTPLVRRFNSRTTAMSSLRTTIPRRSTPLTSPSSSRSRVVDGDVAARRVTESAQAEHEQSGSRDRHADVGVAMTPACKPISFAQHRSQRLTCAEARRRGRRLQDLARAAGHRDAAIGHDNGRPAAEQSSARRGVFEAVGNYGRGNPSLAGVTTIFTDAVPGSNVMWASPRCTCRSTCATLTSSEVSCRP
jgi:hypothetical protein